jgi:tetratricopeptide (TPR) repeat protein
MKALSILLVFLGFHFSSTAQDEEKIVALLQEGVASHDQEKYPEAIEKYKEALALAPEDGEIHYELSFTYWKMKEYDKGIEHADLAIKYSPDIAG